MKFSWSSSEYQQLLQKMIRDFFIVGTPEECIGRIEEFRKAGVRHFI